ncbi:OmpA/MotB family protein [Neobacillus rhizophilus]|uniref:Flagellar motor protein MotB n=1 Tax=Neobacillus rhizophilus TaxID=2833579 RepID=A0A942U7R9_9BACI|nr:flagellar motor protein MotB [Neobacillus rhizophilus]MBS4213019.1 flagellar motor protein MotB [Neobacillus rhizophilus]
MKKRRLQDSDEHMDESWLIPYADLLTLLLALFIVLFASSSINSEKLQQIMISMNSALNGKGSSLILKENASSPAVKPLEKTAGEEKKQEENEKLHSLMENIQSYIEARGLEKVITVQDEPKGIKLSLKDVILFESGSAELKGNSPAILGGLLDLIKGVQNPISIEGHTDNVPITGGTFRSNWELSSARALSVLYFFEQIGIPSNKLQFAGFGEQKPLYPNDTVEHRQANRRVDIMILKVQE